MALAILPPGERAEMDRHRNQIDRLNSVDPVTRFRAKEEIQSEAIASFGSGLVEQAVQNGKAYQKKLKEYERAERAYYKYKPISPSEIKKNSIQD